MSYSDDLKKRELDQASVRNWREYRQKVERFQETHEILKKLKDLDTELLEIYTWRVGSEKSYSFIAKVMGLHYKTVERKFHRAEKLVESIRKARERR